MNIILVANSVLLLLANIILAGIILKMLSRGKFSRVLKLLDPDKAEKIFLRKYVRYKRPVDYKTGFLEKIDLYFVDKSNIRRYIPFLNSKILIAVSLILFFSALKLLYAKLFFLPPAIIISFIFSLVPFFILDLAARYNSEQIRKRLAEFISVLSRWCNVREDIFYAFAKTAESGIGEPLRTFITDMVIQVERGIDPAEALELLEVKVDNVQFRDFIINIKQNIKHRGDIKLLLGNLEAQFYKIEEEYNRRKISTYKDRLIIFSVMIAVLFIAWFFLRLNPQVEVFYLQTLQGKMLLAFFTLLYALGFYFFLGITKFNY